MCGAGALELGLRGKRAHLAVCSSAWRSSAQESGVALEARQIAPNFGAVLNLTARGDFGPCY